MEHFIFTRFNLPMGKSGGRSLQDSWLRERVRIIERFLVPSLQGQTSSAFRWIVMISPDTPEWVRQRSQNWKPGELVEFKKKSEIPAFLEREVSGDQILCSRIDSDDAVSRTYCEELQKAAGDISEWLVFPNGVIWSKDRCLIRNGRPLSAFPTLVDQRPFVGPHCVEHTHLRRFAPMRVVSQNLGWLIHVHQNNILNGPHLLEQGATISPAEVVANFNLNLNQKPVMKRSTLINKLISENGFESYLEVGCAKNKTFNQIQAQRKVGVDPVSGGTIRKTSDQFFQDCTETFDIVFIDGLHHWEQVIRDVTNALKVLRPGGVIVLHDCLPTARNQQLRERSPKSKAWTGDVWKAMVEMRTWSHIDAAVLNSDWGLGVVLPRPNSDQFALDRKVSDLDWDWFEGNSHAALRVLDEVETFLNQPG